MRTCSAVSRSGPGRRPLDSVPAQGVTWGWPWRRWSGSSPSSTTLFLAAMDAMYQARPVRFQSRALFIMIRGCRQDSTCGISLRNPCDGEDLWVAQAAAGDAVHDQRARQGGPRVGHPLAAHGTRLGCSRPPGARARPGQRRRRGAQVSPTTLFLIEGGGGQTGSNTAMCWGDGFFVDTCAAARPSRSDALLSPFSLCLRWAMFMATWSTLVCSWCHQQHGAERAA